MNRLYLIIPLVLICCFWAADRVAVAGRQAQEQSQAAAAALAARKAEDERHALELQAQADAERRITERQASEEKLAADRQALWDADEKRIEGENAEAKAAGSAQAAEIATLQRQLDDLIARQTRLSRETLVLEKAAEQAKLAHHNAETELERLAQVAAERASAKLQPPPAR